VDEHAPNEDIPVHAFDLVVADECHRGCISSQTAVWRQTLARKADNTSESGHKKEVWMIVGHGVDLVEHQSFSRLIEQEEAFLKRCFTDDEIADGKATANPVQWFASRFAAKEATMKALGTGWTQGISWHDIASLPVPTGGMTVRLSGKAALIAEQRNVRCWLLSITHTEHFSMASIIATDDAVTLDN